MEVFAQTLNIFDWALKILNYLLAFTRFSQMMFMEGLTSMGQFMDMEETLMKENENLIDKLGFWRLKKLTIDFR
jgi:hypothetical protein